MLIVVHGLDYPDMHCIESGMLSFQLQSHFSCFTDDAV